MIDLKVPDMHCEKCVSRIHETLEAAQISHEIDLSKKMVSVADDQVDKARSAMDEIGFSSKKPGFFARLFGK